MFNQSPNTPTYRHTPNLNCKKHLDSGAKGISEINSEEKTLWKSFQFTVVKVFHAIHSVWHRISMLEVKLAFVKVFKLVLFSPGSHSEVMFITNSNNISKIEAKNLFGSKLFMTHWHTHTRTTQTPIELHSKRNESNRSIRNFTIQWQIDCTQNNFDVYTAPCQ